MDECLRTFLRSVTELAVELAKQRSVAMNPLDTVWVLDIDFSHGFSSLILQKMQDLVSRNQVERNFWKGLRANKLD